MIKPVGGRGKKAPYTTTVLRVPTDLVPEFEKAIEAFHNQIDSDQSNSNQETKTVKNSLENSQITKEEVLIEAKKLLRAKKSAKVSILKLLQVIYKDNTITEDNLI